MFSVIPMKLIVNCETGPKEVSIISACRIKMPLTTCYFSHSLLPHKNEITTAVWKLAQFSSGVFWMLIHHEKDSDQQVLQLTKKLMATALVISSDTRNFFLLFTIMTDHELQATAWPHDMEVFFFSHPLSWRGHKSELFTAQCTKHDQSRINFQGRQK